MVMMGMDQSLCFNPFKSVSHVTEMVLHFFIDTVRNFAGLGTVKHTALDRIYLSLHGT